jgi:hypothetical protein
MAMGGLLVVGTLTYFVLSKDDRRKLRDDRHNERLAHRP